RRCVGVAHAELRKPTGGFEKNNPSTCLADGAGELHAESGHAANDVQHRTVDDFQHPTSKSSHAGRPGVAKSNPSSSSANSSSTSQACRPCFGRGRSAESCAGTWLARKLALPGTKGTTLPPSPLAD